MYASTFDPNDQESRLEAIKTDKEWKVIETILDTLQEEVRNKKNKGSEEEYKWTYWNVDWQNPKIS